MKNIVTSAQILDFKSYREKTISQDNNPEMKNMTPVMMWVPVWVMVPTPTEPDYSI
jgi:hypothetical protein